MDTLLSLANWVIPLVYLALAIDYGATFVLRVRTHARNPWVIIAIALHVLLLGLREFHLGGGHLVSNYEILSVVALSSAIVYWVTERLCRDRRAGVFVFLLIFLCQYTSSVFLAGSAEQSPGGQGWGRLHVLPASLAYTALGFAALYALLYLIGQRNLKRHRFGLLFDRLPPLELLGKMGWYALLGGFVFMTITIATGPLLFGGETHTSEDVYRVKLIAKIVIGSIAWIVCATGILGKWLGKWPASRVSQIALVGFAAIVALLITSIVLS